VLLQVRVVGGFGRAAWRGSRLLSRYLRAQSGASALPAISVLQEPAGNSAHLVSVVVPAGLDPEALTSAPNGPVRMSVLPAHEAAVLRFTGGWRAGRAAALGAHLLSCVGAHGLESLGSVYFARLGPVLTPGFLQRNEALVRVTSA
jgi:hypothetical protein